MAMAYSTQFNLDKLRQSLFARKGRFEAEMRSAAEEGAEKIMAKSQDNSPVDTLNLEEAHHIEKTVTLADHVRFKIEVSGMGYGSDRPRDVASYAMEMHEHLAPYGSGEYNLGPKSRAKAAGGADVGGKFLERALESEKAQAIQMIREAVRRNWK